MSEQKLGIVGIGRMGLPIAARLRDAGLEVAVTDLEHGLQKAAEDEGLVWVPELGDLASTSEVVITVLPGPGEVRQVIEPILARLRPGGTWIDMTSAVPAVSAEIRGRASSPTSVHILECPVGGDPTAARSGTLLGYVGTDPDDLKPHRSMLEALCRELVHIGPPGTGYAVKLLVNALWFGQALAVAETLALGSRLGLDPRALKHTLTRGPAAGRIVEEAGDALLRGDDMATFPLARCVEELEGVLDLAAAPDRLSLPLTSRVAELYGQALERFGDADGELLAARYLSEQLGVCFS